MLFSCQNRKSWTRLFEILKIKISDWANSGCYCFRDGIELERECDALLKAGEMQLSQDKVGE